MSEENVQRTPSFWMLQQNVARPDTLPLPPFTPASSDVHLCALSYDRWALFGRLFFCQLSSPMPFSAKSNSIYSMKYFSLSHDIVIFSVMTAVLITSSHTVWILQISLWSRIMFYIFANPHSTCTESVKWMSYKYFSLIIFYTYVMINWNWSHQAICIFFSESS